MVSRPKISVIIPVYNSEQHLERCFESLINQRCQDFEIVVVNDGSTDKSLQICNNFHNILGERLTIVSQENKGASIARRNGINAAKGDYLIFMDSDDFVSPEYVSALYGAIEKSGCKISLCKVKRVEIGERYDFLNPDTPALIEQSEIFKRFFKYEFWGLYGTCYEKELFNTVDFPTATICEDYYVKAQIFSNISQAAIIETPLYVYEQHPNSLSHQPLSLRALEEIDNTFATWRYFEKHNPSYTQQALAIASESAIKWQLRIKRSPKYNIPSIMAYYNRSKIFLKENIISIIFNKYLLWKLKPIIIKNLIF